jgi:hypothetical protein
MYHVAAILCKKDHTLWVRAADSAAEIAGLAPSSVNDIPGIRENVTFHKREKGKMAARSEEDYRRQTILPGIDVPAKYFASALIQLGKFFRSLDAATDSKNTEWIHGTGNT